MFALMTMVPAPAALPLIFRKSFVPFPPALSVPSSVRSRGCLVSTSASPVPILSFENVREPVNVMDDLAPISTSSQFLMFAFVTSTSPTFSTSLSPLTPVPCSLSVPPSRIWPPTAKLPKVPGSK